MLRKSIEQRPPNSIHRVNKTENLLKMIMFVDATWQIKNSHVDGSRPWETPHIVFYYQSQPQTK